MRHTIIFLIAFISLTSLAQARLYLAETRHILAYKDGDIYGLIGQVQSMTYHTQNSHLIITMLDHPKSLDKVSVSNEQLMLVQLLTQTMGKNKVFIQAKKAKNGLLRIESLKVMATTKE
jgi:hypothetical protein